MEEIVTIWQRKLSSRSRMLAAHPATLVRKQKEKIGLVWIKCQVPPLGGDSLPLKGSTTVSIALPAGDQVFKHIPATAAD